MSQSTRMPPSPTPETKLQAGKQAQGPPPFAIACEPAQGGNSMFGTNPLRVCRVMSRATGICPAIEVLLVGAPRARAQAHLGLSWHTTTKGL